MGCKRTTVWGNNIVSWLVVGIIISMLRIRPLVHALDSEPTNFNYIHLWTSEDGETHIKQCKMHNFTLKVYSALPQYQRSDFGGLPTKTFFTELPVGFTQPLHPSPAVQFAITLIGHWYLNATDGSQYTFGPGKVLFQDDVVRSPADKVGQHYSGTIGNVPCQQLIVQVNRPAQVDHPCPF